MRMVLIFRKRHFATRLCSCHPEVGKPYHRASSVDFFSFPALFLRFPMLLTQTVGQTGSILLFLPLSRPPGDSPRQALAFSSNILNEAPGHLAFSGSRSLCFVPLVPLFNPLRTQPAPPPGCDSPLDSKLKPRPEGQAPPPPLAGPAPHSPEASPRARRLLGVGGEGRCRVGRGVASPPLWPRWPSAGGMGSLRRRQPGRSRDLGAQGWRLHLHQGLHLRRDRPPHRAPFLTAIPPLRNNFRSHYQATGDWAKHRAPPSQGDC